MMILFGMRLAAGAWTELNWAMLLVSGLSCVLVFKCFVYIFNFSYALACIFNGLILALELPGIGSTLLGGAMFIYGLRLLLFTWNRVQSESYQPRVEAVQQADAQLPFFLKIVFWLQCTFMYTFHLFAIYLVGTSAASGPGIWLAAVIILAGTFIEGLADQQKQTGKAANPSSFVTNGLFARWRHPNYAGEIIVQIGLITAGLSAVSAGWGNYAAVTIAPLYVILLMLSECTRADKYQQLRYGDNPDYQAYLHRSGSLFPR